jgi:HAD superfamily hydrolase (TIGR01509 family)
LIKGVILDMDGLMINSEPLAQEAWQLCLAPYRKTMSTELYRSLIGVSHEESARVVIDQCKLDIAVAELDARFRIHFHALANAAPPCPGLHPLLQEIEQRGYLLGIASNSPVAHVMATARRVGIAAHFRCMVGADQVNRGKPAPDVYLLAACCLRLDPASCLAVEDSPSGLQSARLAGIPCVFIPNPDLPPTSADGAEAVYPSLLAWHADLDRLLPDWRASRP